MSTLTDSTNIPSAGRLDVLLRRPGMAVTVADLVAVFIGHRPGDAPTCGHCGHRYTKAAPLCPSRTLAQTLLRQRRHEDANAVAGIRQELDQRRDTRHLPAGPPARPRTPAGDGLFDIDPAWRTRRKARR